mmetsp:Transcript_31762/g.78730  ORF Transcript_31762/g.78730 Transcript_31762/m.78730 type:complete len:262 (-) Transcript_31762:338-1123(-)
MNAGTHEGIEHTPRSSVCLAHASRAHTRQTRQNRQTNGWPNTAHLPGPLPPSEGSTERGSHPDARTEFSPSITSVYHVHPSLHLRGPSDACLEFLFLLLLGESLPAVLDVLALDAPAALAALTLHLGVVVEHDAALVAQLLHRRRVLLAHLRQRHGGSRLLVHQLAQPGLALDDAVRHVLATAQRRQPHDQFDGVDVVSDDNELRDLVFDEVGDVVEAELDEVGLPAPHGHVAALRLLLSLTLHTLPSLSVGLRLVLVEQS